MLAKITDNIEGKFDEETTSQQASKLNKHCVTRWTVRAVCFRKIKENCQALLQLMRDSLEEKLDFETKSRIVGCKKQLESFSFFRLNLGQKLYAHTDNLSKYLQQKKMSAVKGKKLADLTVKALQAMKNGCDFNLFYETVKNSGSTIKDISTPTVPRKH